MAKQIPTFPDRSYSTRYPWTQWLDGSIWTLTQGVDFHVTPKAFQAAAFAASKRKGKKLRTSVFPTSITFQALPWSEK